MTTESDLESPEGVRTYRGRTLEEILPQIREELGPDAIILREREGLVGGVGGFFAQRFIEVEARSGDEQEQPRSGGSSIDIYDEDEDEPGYEPASPGTGAEAGRARPLLPAGDPGEEPMDITASRGTPTEPAPSPEPKPFIPPELRRERIIPRDPQGEPAPPTRRFETDVFLERLREASQFLPEDDEQLQAPVADVPSAAAGETEAPAEVETAAEGEAGLGETARSEQPLSEPAAQPAGGPVDSEAEARPRRPDRRTTPERKPRPTPQRRPRAAPRSKPSGKPDAKPEQPTPAAPQPIAVDPWTAAMAALVRETEPEGPTPPEPTRGAGSAPVRPPYEERRQRPGSLRAGLPTEPSTAPRTAAEAPPAAGPAARHASVRPVPPVAPLEIRTRREGGLRGMLARLFGGRLGPTTLPKPSPARPIDAAAASAITGELNSRGASQAWSAQLIGTAAAHGTALSGSLLAATEAEIARRIVPAPVLPATGAAVAFIGAGGSGKTRCTAALASAYSRASTLGVVVIAVDNPNGARELKRLLESDGVPVLSLNPERAAQAVAAYREGGFVIIDTPTTTPTDPAALDALGASLAALELDATFVTLPATLGPQAARRALAGFGRLNPSAVAITHGDETDQLGVVVEIAIANRIPLAYLHAGTDHRSAISAIGAGTIAQELLAS